MATLARQTNYQTAADDGFERARSQTPKLLEALGAEGGSEGVCWLPVLNAVFRIDFDSHAVTFAMKEADATLEGPVGKTWEILTLHYLCAHVTVSERCAKAGAPGLCAMDNVPGGCGRAIVPANCARPSTLGNPSDWSFADFPDARGYQSVYRGRVLGRFLATAGRTRESFIAAAERLGGQPVPLSGVGYRFDVFPRISVGVAWYEGDGELPPDASFVYPSTIQTLLSAEDIIVLSEGLVARLQGRGW